MERFRSRRGQSLMEVLIGIGLGALFIIGAVGIIAPSLKTDTQVSEIQTKAQLASELLNNVRSWSAGNWNGLLSLATGTGNTYYLNTTSSPFTVVAASSTSGISSPSFALAQTGAQGSANGISSSCAFARPPGLGDLVVVGIDQANNPPPQGATVQDANGNSFTVTPTSPTSSESSVITGATYLAYLLSAPANASQTITATISGGGGVELECDDFTVSSGTIAFDQAEAGSGSGGTTINTPNVAMSGTLDLLYAVGIPQHVIVSANNPWTVGGGGVNSFDGGASEYIMNATSSVSTSFTVNSSGAWNTQGASFALSPIVTGGYSGTSTESISQTTSGGTIVYDRYFYVSDVYRDASGNVTTTVSGNHYDPSTKLITVVVMASTTPPSGSTIVSTYLTRNADSVVNQTSWAGGIAAGPVTAMGSAYATENDVNVNATGSILLASPPGGTCTL